MDEQDDILQVCLEFLFRETLKKEKKKKKQKKKKQNSIQVFLIFS